MVTYREEEAILEQIRVDIKAAQGLICEKNRTAGLLLAANGVLITFYLSMFFPAQGNAAISNVFNASVSPSNNPIILNLSFLNASFSLLINPTAPNLSVFQIYSTIPIIIFCISAVLCLLVLLSNAKEWYLTSVNNPYIRPNLEKPLGVPIIHALIYRGSYYHMELLRNQIEISNHLSLATFAFVFGIGFGVTYFVIFFLTGTSKNDPIIIAILGAAIIGILVGFIFYKRHQTRKVLNIIDAYQSGEKEFLQRNNII
jgi:uncharacterized integral membrane protein